MNILYLHQYFTFPTGAGGTRSYDLAQRFMSAGHKVTVITTSAYMKNYGPFHKKWTVLQQDGLEIHVLKLEYSNRLSFAKRVNTFLKFLYNASLRVLRLKGDIVLATSTPITIAVPALMKKMLHRTPFIFEVRDVWPEAPIAIGAIKNKLLISMLNRFERYIYRRSVHIVALSDDMKASILNRTNTPDAKITVIPNISEINRFGNYKNDAEIIAGLIGHRPERSLLYAGTLGNANGLRYMVDLASHTKQIDPRIRYLIFGDGMEKDMLVKHAADAGVLNENLFFLDPVPKALLPQLYAEVTVASSFYVPVKELWANSANKFFDCLAAGRPVVINYGGWQADVIRKNDIGFILDEDTTHIPAEAKRFCEYINDAALLKEQGAAAQKVAKENYSLEVASGNYLKILEHVV